MNAEHGPHATIYVLWTRQVELQVLIIGITVFNTLLEDDFAS
jgi:hypothetical protein